MAALYDRGVEFFNSVRALADPRTRNWLLLQDTPVYVWICSILYLLFVWIGPKVMRSRPAFHLRGFMILYNTSLVCLSAYIVYEIWSTAYTNGYNMICEPFNAKEAYKNPSEMRMAKALWWYFFSKLIEFTDTILMVLRKKSEQITFLHVFHHVSMLNIWWFCTMLVPGGQSWFGSSLNSFVHIIMYTYYLLNLFPSLRKHLWWKIYITRFQLVQFVIIFVHSLYTILGKCDYPQWAAVLLTSYMIIMVILFGNFYFRAYTSSKRSKAVHQHDTSNDGDTLDSNFNIKIE